MSLSNSGENLTLIDNGGNGDSEGAQTIPLLNSHGLMFWFIRKTLSGSYVRLSVRSRSYFSAP